MALALDIDGTIQPGDVAEIRRLTQQAAHLGVRTYINTARHAVYCETPDDLTTQFADPADHFCLSHADPPVSKVTNMRLIAARARVRPDQVLLIDDRPENVDAVRAAGFRAMYVDANVGIQRTTVDDALAILRNLVPRSYLPFALRVVLVLLVARAVL